MLYIIRHGQTAKNKAGALQGRSDLPLNENGIAQARAAAKWAGEHGICFDRVYSSPLSRAKDTGLILAPDAKILVDERLIEMDYGPYEGMDLKNPSEEVKNFFEDFVHNPAPEGMESLQSVTRRLGEFLEEIRTETRGKNILLSTHAIAMKGALEYLTPESRGSYWATFIGNCSIYAAENDEEEYGIPSELWVPKK